MKGVVMNAVADLPVYHSFAELQADPDPVLPPVIPLTAGPKYHWFGYYLHHQFDPSGRYLLCTQVDFENRLPEPGDAVKVGLIDLQDGNRWTELGESRAWSWQQSCFVQWRPGSATEIIWNDRDGERAVARVLDIQTGKQRSLPLAIDEAISPDGRWAICSDFSRIWKVRPGYGYPGLENAATETNAPDGVGIWRMDLDSGEITLLASIADLVALPFNNGLDAGKYHYVNHCQWSPDGKRFSLFHRWREQGQPTRVYTMAADGTDVRLLSAEGASHWTWRDSEHVVIWGLGGYRLYRDDNSGAPREVLWEAPNGHQSFVPGTNNEWMVTDTYPQGEQRTQFLQLVHLPTLRFLPLGRFRSDYSGEWRCDLHARTSRDGRRVVIDSTHGGNGRQQYMINIGEIIARHG